MNKGTPSKAVDMFDKHGNFIKTFPSVRQAAIEVIKLRNSTCTLKCMSNKISDACNHRRDTFRNGKKIYIADKCYRTNNMAATYIFEWHNE